MDKRNALLAFGLCGTVGVLIDIDHVIAYYIGWDERFLHTPLLIVASIVLCGLIARTGGLLVRLALRKGGEGNVRRRKT